MRIVIVSPTDLTQGRDAENMLAGILPALAAEADVWVVSLGPMGKEFAAVAASCPIPVTQVEYRARGCFVDNADRIGQTVQSLATLWGADLVVLYREIWDLFRVLRARCRVAGIPFTVLFHAMPLANAPARPSRFTWDALRQVVRDRDPLALAYTLLRLGGVRRGLRDTPVISVNETVTYYLDRYFPDQSTVEALPGAAARIPAGVDRQQAEYDCVFMAKLIPCKGLFLLPRILARVAAVRPGARLLVLGNFERVADERRFHRALRRHGVANRVDLAGWVRGARKYELLASGRVFLYPSYAGDTFAIALLEALACGLPAVTYDVPFVRVCYDTPAVRRVPLGAHAAFGDAVLALLAGDPAATRMHAQEFAARYASWADVAAAQLAAFRRITGDGSIGP